MKIKSFLKLYNVSFEEFDDEINEFIKDKNIIDIKFQKIDNNTYVLVLYEDKEGLIMDLWIRSQDGEMLFKAKEFKITSYNGNRCLIECDEYAVAVYATKQRAKEVLNEIHQRIIDLQTVKIAPDAYKTIGKKGRSIDCVYQMPKE